MRNIIAVVFGVLACVSSVLAIQGEIISCSGCKLNYRHEVRRFLKEPGHADAYKNLKVTFISGRNPDLFLRSDTGEELEKIDLSELTTKGIHDLLLSKGFERHTPEVPEEGHFTPGPQHNAHHRDLSHDHDHDHSHDHSHDHHDHTHHDHAHHDHDHHHDHSDHGHHHHHHTESEL